MKQIEKLTKEAESFIELIRQKWRKIALDTGPLNRKKADLAVKEAYRALGWREPEIIFLNSPHGVGEIIKQKSPEELAKQLGAPLLLLYPLNFPNSYKPNFTKICGRGYRGNCRTSNYLIICLFGKIL